MIELGSKARDVITGFTGTVTARVEYLTGCTQYCLSAKSGDGKLGEGHFLDEPRLEVLSKPDKKVAAMVEATRQSKASDNGADRSSYGTPAVR
jgi:hypothetical protein